MDTVINALNTLAGELYKNYGPTSQDILIQLPHNHFQQMACDMMCERTYFPPGETIPTDRMLYTFGINIALTPQDPPAPLLLAVDTCKNCSHSGVFKKDWCGLHQRTVHDTQICLDWKKL